MRYGIIPTRLLEWVALRFGHVPTPVLDGLLAPLQTRALLAAQRLGVLDALVQPSELAPLARALSLDAECLELLLRVLQAMGYAREQRGRWQLTAMARKHFGPRATTPHAASIEHAALQWSVIERLEDVLRTGTGVDYHQVQSEPDWAVYQRAMLENAQGFAWFVRDHLPVAKGATRCVDIAGSHGLVAAELCKKHAGLRATVIDRAEALPHARRIARERGYDRDVAFVEGDVLDLALAPGVDVAVLSNILHHFTVAQNRAMLARLHASMAKGGSVGIFEIETPAHGAPPDAAGDGLALYFRITSSSACFRAQEYLDWLRAAGFRDARVVRSVRMPSRMLVVARA